jgi:NADPH:quinone reductase-like Zn-dependent oxidoreductase
MKAIIFERHGGLEELKWVSVPDPKPSEGEVLIKVRACALNHLDIWERQGLPGVSVPLPHISGSDIAGEVAQLGPGVKKIKTGSKVLVSPGISCERCDYCRKGYDSLCPEYRLVGLQIDGGYAEYVKVPVRALHPISDKYSFEEWAALPLVFLTAWHMLITRAKLARGETVLIHAAGSGIGSAAIQVAKWRGAMVIATAGSEEKLKGARSLGADYAIHYKQRDFADEVRRITENRGADVVFEHIGPETWAKSMASLAKGGRLVTCGATSGPQVTMDLRFLFAKQLSVLGSYMGGRKELAEVLLLAEQGRLKPIVDSTYPLGEARKAQERMLERKQFGKIVLIP